MSELTSIKIPVQVRDRLAVAAEARGITVRSLLDALSRRAVDEALMARVGGEMARLEAEGPTEWAGYLAEGREWDEATVAPVT
jgi:hypothetical protein